MIDIEKIKQLLNNVSIIKEIDFLTNKNIRIQTNFLYHDTHYIDIFIPHNERILTDFGNTICMKNNYWELSLNFDLIKENFLCNDDTKFGAGGMLLLEFKEDLSDFVEKLLELIQTCIALSVYIHCVYLAGKKLL